MQVHVLYPYVKRIKASNTKSLACLRCQQLAFKQNTAVVEEVPTSECYGCCGFRVTGSRVTGSRVTGFRVTGSRVAGFRVPGAGVAGAGVAGSRVAGTGGLLGAVVAAASLKDEHEP